MSNPGSDRSPRVAYILLWFPKPTETFVFDEVAYLLSVGLQLKVFTLYGELTRGLCSEMMSFPDRVERLGISSTGAVLSGLSHWWRKDRRRLGEILREPIYRRLFGVEKTAENMWAFLCGFRLARRFEEEAIHHIHAPWASGPATAAWVASTLTGIPFSFTARAWDIHPPDGALEVKIRDAAFVRSESCYNVPYLVEFGGDRGKIHLTYNGVASHGRVKAPVRMEPPYRLLALGRFVGKKGYEYLILACKKLEALGVDFHLVLAGDGALRPSLKRLVRRLDLTERISFPGFIPHDRVSELFHRADVFLVPSIVHASGDRDGLPTVIIESLLHRVPVIATDVSGIPEVIEHDMTGLLVPQKDPGALASAVMKLTSNRARAIEMAETGRSKVLEQFNPDRNYGKVLELYGRLITPDGQTTWAREREPPSR